MSAPELPPPPMDGAAAPRPELAFLRECLHRLEAILPGQAPLTEFVHHNTLHGYEHLPFARAIADAARLTGARPWPDDAEGRRALAEGALTPEDLRAGLAEDGWSGTPLPGLAASPRDAALQALCHDLTPPGAARLLWLAEEEGAFVRLAADLDPAVRARWLAGAGSAPAEAALVGALWAACVARTEAPGEAAPAGEAGGWAALAGRVGCDWTRSDLLRALTGEDPLHTVRTPLIRHLAAHLDRGQAVWRNPAAGQGFYAAWRASAARDWRWALDELPLTPRALAELPAAAEDALLAELAASGVPPAGWAAYLERLALELPGWSGLFLRHEHHPAAGQPPVAMVDYLAVRLILERTAGEAVTRRHWGIPCTLPALAAHLAGRADELAVRLAHHAGALPEALAADAARLAALGPAAEARAWAGVARAARRAAGHALRLCAPARHVRDAVAAWPLFRLAQYLGLGPEAVAAAPAATLAALQQACDLPPEARGFLWLRARERRQAARIGAALAANRGRGALPPEGAEAQLVFCMDDREEGARRHLEAVNPRLETFGAAGFFAVPMWWQGLDDAAPVALCPVVVRPLHRVAEQPAAALPDPAVQAYRQARARRAAAAGWLARRTRANPLLALPRAVLEAPLALAGLLAGSLAPGAVARWRAAFAPAPLPTELALTAPPATAVPTPEAPRAGFTDDEQAERVAALLVTIGLTRDFAPLVVLFGHGSDSRNNPHRAAYDCGACSGRHGGPNARVFAAMANRPAVRERLAARGIVIPPDTHFLGAEHNTTDESLLWFDREALPASHHAALARLEQALDTALGRHAVERCRRLRSAPRAPTPARARAHLADRRHDPGQARPELGHATVAWGFVGRRAATRGLFLDRRAFLISYDPVQDAAGTVLESLLLAVGPVGAGISLEYYFSTVDNERLGAGSKVLHNVTGRVAVMAGTASDLRTGLPRQMVEIHEAMRLLLVVEQAPAVIGALYARQSALQRLVGNGWVRLAALDPSTGGLHCFDPAQGWQPWPVDAGPVPRAASSEAWFAGASGPLPPALLPVAGEAPA